MMFSEHLLELRTKAGLTQQETAKGSKMSLRAYQNYEWGLREPKMTALSALADFYDISRDERACRTWPKKPEA